MAIFLAILDRSLPLKSFFVGGAQCGFSHLSASFCFCCVARVPSFFSTCRPSYLVECAIVERSPLAFIVLAFSRSFLSSLM